MKFQLSWSCSGKAGVTPIGRTSVRHADACIEDIDYRTPRHLDKALFQQLARGKWIAAKQNLIGRRPV